MGGCSKPSWGAVNDGRVPDPPPHVVTLILSSNQKTTVIKNNHIFYLEPDAQKEFINDRVLDLLDFINFVYFATLTVTERKIKIY